MAELLCFSVVDCVGFFLEEHRVTSTDFAAAPSAYSCSHRKRIRQLFAPSLLDSSGFKGLVLPCVYCSRTRCCALWFVDDDGRALFFGR